MECVGNWKDLIFTSARINKIQEGNYQTFIQIKKLINKDSIVRLTPYKLQRLFVSDLKNSLEK